MWKNRQRQLNLDQLEFEEQEEDDRDEFDDSPWMPSGLYAALVITCWSATLKLIDAIEENGPAVCSRSEEVRLWICAGALTAIQGIAEAILKRKKLIKILFSMVCVLAYMTITHTQPLSCRLGESRVSEVSKWQSAIFFFVTAILVAVAYHDLKSNSKRRRKIASPRMQGRKSSNYKNQNYDSVDLNLFELNPQPPAQSLVPSTV